MKQVHPAIALVMAMGSFIAASVAFNFVVFVLHLIHLEELFGWLVRGLSVISLLIFMMPFIGFIERASSHRRELTIWAALILSSFYLFAVLGRHELVAHWLFPYWPGMDNTPIYLHLIASGFFVIAATTAAYFMVAPMSSATRREDDDLEGEVLGELAKSVGDGLGEHFHHH